jgi:hypothetical protein
LIPFIQANPTSISSSVPEQVTSSAAKEGKLSSVRKETLIGRKRMPNKVSLDFTGTP